MSFEARGWARFGFEQSVVDWALHAAPVARQIASDPQHQSDWLRCGGTWFVGVNLLPNDAAGRVGGGAEFSGQASDFASQISGWSGFEPAQISVIYPGYPKPSPAESEPAFRFRRDRDAGHVDGLLPIGPDKRRHLREPHAFVLGVPLNDADASPMVVWEGSHKIMRAAFRTLLASIPPERWGEVDLTKTYHAARKQCFETCPRVEVSARMGEAYVIDRLTLHGVAPWAAGHSAPPEGRMIAYFRPELDQIGAWLDPAP